MSIRYPVVAGSWYAGTKESLRGQIEHCFKHRIGPGKIPDSTDGPKQILALISPHAGYMYSGPVAAHAYAALAIDGARQAMVILGPNHVGLGSAVSLMAQGKWRTPLGDAEIDTKLARAIEKESEIIDLDETAHRFEHSIEMQIPFLQYLYKKLRFVPICMMLQDLETSRDVGKAIAKAIEGKNVIVIATTDLTHHEPHEQARMLDSKAIDAVLKLDEVTLQKRVRNLNLSTCGYGPVSATLVAAKELGATKAKLLRYATSGDVTGEKSSVVGYASFKIFHNG